VADGLIDRADTLDVDGEFVDGAVEGDDGAEDALLADGALVDAVVAVVVAVVAGAEVGAVGVDGAVDVVDLAGDLPVGAPDVDVPVLP
jgi:hypothetical protein